MMFFISNAFADAGSAAQVGGGIMSFLPMIGFIAILYFLLIRPQQKRAKQHQAMISAIKKGDKVLTGSGIIATVSKIVNDQEVMLEIAEGVFCRFLKSTISSVITNGNVVVDSCCPFVSPEKSKDVSDEKSDKNDQKSEKTATKKVVPAKKPAANAKKTEK